MSIGPLTLSLRRLWKTMWSKLVMLCLGKRRFSHGCGAAQVPMVLNASSAAFTQVPAGLGRLGGGSGRAEFRERELGGKKWLVAFS